MRQNSLNALVLVLASLVAAVWPIGAYAEDVRWQTRPALARTEANRSNRPMFILVTSRDCGWCRKLESTTLRDPRVVHELNARTIPIKVDADDPANARLVAAIKIEGLPTSAIVRPNGRISQTRAGYLDPSEFLGWLREAAPVAK